MQLAFLNRSEELARLRAALARRTSTLTVLYGRRRCGKSRLLRHALAGMQVAYYVGDDREGILQRSALAAELARIIPGFDQVTYPEWGVLFSRWWEAAPPGAVLALDEFPALVARAREIPSLLQKHIDVGGGRRIHVVLAGSSQRMMHGLVLDRSAPLYGRANEILRLGPLPAGWTGRALRLRSAAAAVEAYAVWGGVPRYWELARDYSNLDEALQEVLLNPMGVLHREPSGLLLDDLRDTTQAASILSLIGQGCHRPSEIAARLGKPATSMSRPLSRLLDLGIIRRDCPFGILPRDSKRTLYRIADPFLRFWFRYVDPNRSRLEARQESSVLVAIKRTLSQHVGTVWEDLARESVPRLRCFDQSWKPASVWWGTGVDRRPMEIDLVAESESGNALLLGEAKWSKKSNAIPLLAQLKEKAQNCPLVRGREVKYALWLRSGATRTRRAKVYGPEQVLRVLK